MAKADLTRIDRGRRIDQRAISIDNVRIIQCLGWQGCKPTELHQSFVRVSSYTPGSDYFGIALGSGPIRGSRF